MNNTLLILFILVLFGCESDPYFNTCELNSVRISPRIEAEDSITIFLPTAFTPNGDGLNEKFYPAGTNILSYSVSVSFNNKVVFEGGDNEKWNGANEDDKIVQGNYDYEINVRSKKNKNFVVTGVISLINDPAVNVCKCRFEDMIDPSLGFVHPSIERCK